jgi:MYXO-CTERM domain-containing protein
MIHRAPGLLAALLAVAAGATTAAAEDSTPAPIHVRFADAAGNTCSPRGCRGPAGAFLQAARAAGVGVANCYGLPAPLLKAHAERAEKWSAQRAPDLTQCFTLTPRTEPQAVEWSSRAAAAPGVQWVERATPLYPAQMPVPDFSGGQFILEDAPQGLGVRSFWARTGLRGRGVTFVDIELGTDPAHVELRRFGGLLDAPGAGTSILADGDTDDHGLACMGMVVGAVDAHGIDGMAPDAEPYFFTAYPTEYTWGVGPALLRALDTLDAGDVVLLELQRPGPNYDAGRDESGQWGMVPVEWSRVDRDALRVASAQGVTVIEPAGNGFQDLDAPEYEGRFTEFDSGALMVGAGNPPGGEYGPPREAMTYSNFGTRVDLQGYGAAVVTAGYGDLWGAEGTPDRYSAVFGGTSAASPQVAGVAVLIASRLRTDARFLMPEQLREILARTGTPGAASLGPLPDAVAALRPALAESLFERPPEPPRDWSLCRVDADCGGSRRCVQVAANERYCLPDCEPFAPEDESVCAPGFGCALQVWGGGICLFVEGLGRTGDPCLDELDCAVNYYCDATEGCQPLCSVQRDAGCAQGQTCLFSGDDFGDWGVCERTSPNPDGLPDGAACMQDADCQGGTCYDPGTGLGFRCTTLGCRGDADCHGAGAVCVSAPEVGVPYCTAPCRADADCGAGLVCQNAACVPAPAECGVDEDCGVAQACLGGRCGAAQACDTSDDCPAERWCRAGGCFTESLCTRDAECHAAEACVDFVCVPFEGCRRDADCRRGERCVDGTCEVPAPPPPLCPPHRVPRGDACIPDGTCDVQADCPDRYRCEARRCVRFAVCDVDADCGGGFVCRDAFCVPPRCTADRQCGAGFACVDSACTLRAVAPVADAGVDARDALSDAGSDAAPDGQPWHVPLTPDAAGGPSVSPGRGCGCRAAGEASGGAPLALLALVGVGLRRRRSAAGSAASAKAQRRAEAEREAR